MVETQAMGCSVFQKGIYSWGVKDPNGRELAQNDQSVSASESLSDLCRSLSVLLRRQRRKDQKSTVSSRDGFL